MIRTAALLLCVVACSKSEPRAPPSPPSPAAPAPKDPACELAIVIDATGVSIGTTAGLCRAPRVDGKPDIPWLEAELGALRYHLADCPPVATIVAETGPYQELITVLDVATKEGFIDSGVGDPSDVPFPMAGASVLHCKAPSPRTPAPKVAKPVVEDHPIIPPLTPEEVRKLEEQKPLEVELPPPDNSGVQQAPVIIVTSTEITFQGRVVAAVADVTKDANALEPLAAALRTQAESTKRKLTSGGFSATLVKACEDAKRGIRPVPGSICPEGLAILQADEATDMRVINALLHTAKAAGFDNLLFAVKNKERLPQ